jgi:BA14K-like protein
MIKLAVIVTTATVLACAAITTALAQHCAGRTLRFGNPSGWYFDRRDDRRDFPTNGYFPGSFAATPTNVAIGGAGIFGSTPWHSAASYPSQVIIRSAARDSANCARRYRSYDPASGTFVGNDGARHPC